MLIAWLFVLLRGPAVVNKAPAANLARLPGLKIALLSSEKRD
ncbi:hypothetical protein [Paracoccus thiocyanatus]|nr:hypothetical protein [Paracoccus thiocyanatus]